MIWVVSYLLVGVFWLGIFTETIHETMKDIPDSEGKLAMYVVLAWPVFVVGIFGAWITHRLENRKKQ